MTSRPHFHSAMEPAGARCLDRGWRRALLLIVALSAISGPAVAGDLEDCNGPPGDKTESACAAVIADASRPADDRVKAYVGRARLYTSRAKLDLASNDAEAALALDPQSVPALLQRGYLRQRAGSFDLARADIDRAIELEPKNPFAFMARGGLRADQRAFADALADFDQALALRQDLPAAHVGRARALVETGQLDQALGEVNTALAIDPNAPNAFFWRGQAYRRKGDVDHAIEDFSRAIAQAPQTERGSYFARGQLFSAKGEYARAIADFDKLLTFVPDNKEIQQQRQSAIAMQAELARVATGKPAATAPALPPKPAVAAAPSQNQQIELARQFIAQGNFAAAIERLNPLLAADPGNEMGLRLRALSFMRLSRLAEARNDLNDLLKLKPNDAALLVLKGRSAEGLVDINGALDKNPNNQAAQLGRGLALLTSGQFDRAVASFNQIVGKMPDDTFARLMRARALLAMKKPSEAMTDLNFVLNVRPGFADALALRGIAWSVMLDYTKARDDLDKAIAQKETVESYFARAKVHEALNNPKKATDDFRRATQLTPAGVFDVLAQAESKRKIQELSKRLPCGDSGQTGTCL